MPKTSKQKTALVLATAIFMVGSIWHFSAAATVDELKNQISTKNDTIKKLEEDIKKYNTAVQNTQAQKKTLQGEIKQIDTTRAKLGTDIKLTGQKIDVTKLTINSLGSEIGVKVQNIGETQVSMEEILRSISTDEFATDNIIFTWLSAGSLSDALAETDNLSKLQKKLVEKLATLRNLKTDLEIKKTDKEKEKERLAGLQSQLADQKKIADQTKKEKDTVLSETKSKEAAYQSLLAASKKKKQQVESEIANIEQQIKIAINPELLPTSGPGTLLWPVSPVRITQYFGNTDFATKNPTVYNGKGHNGVDFGIPTGTVIKSAAEGVVIGAGDTDITCKGASYGKWVLVKHTNGLSTLYAHLSLIKVQEGQAVGRGDLLAYSGNTGYSTGPHLHFTVYASQGVSVSSLKSKVPGCGTYRMPIGSYNSYLNPLSYL